MDKFSLQDLQTITSMILGYGKNGKPRAIWDVVVETQKISDGKKKKRKSKKKKKHRTSSSLQDFYKDAFRVDKMEW